MSEKEIRFNKLLSDLVSNYNISTREELEKEIEKKPLDIGIFTIKPIKE